MPFAKLIPKPFPQYFVCSGIFREHWWKLCQVLSASVWATSLEGGLRSTRDSEKLAKSREWHPSGAPTTNSTVNFTLHTNGNVIYNLKEEDQKGTVLDSYTQESITVSEFKQTLFWRTTFRMLVSQQLAKQSSDNCYLTIQWRIHADIVCKNCSWLKLDYREKIIAGIKQSERADVPISDNSGELWFTINDGATDHLNHLMRKELSREMDL